MWRFGLIGRHLGHSFSRGYHMQRFSKLGLDAVYDNYELKDAAEVRDLFHSDPLLVGVNVTLPYKRDVIAVLDSLDPVAADIGAVNTIVRTEDGLKGYNTDVTGFSRSLKGWLGQIEVSALVLGTGGAAAAVCKGLALMGMSFRTVSRSVDRADFTYEGIGAEVVAKHKLIVNCTPLGMSPHESLCPVIPYQSLTADHWCFDLIYNPEKTIFMTNAELSGAHVKNGLEMLHFQADDAWQIWKPELERIQWTK